MLASGFDNDKEALTIRAPPAYEPCKAGEAVEYAW
jgi:hypothetical protein